MKLRRAGCRILRMRLTADTTEGNSCAQQTRSAARLQWPERPAIAAPRIGAASCRSNCTGDALRRLDHLLQCGVTLALVSLLSVTVAAEPLPSSTGLTSREFVGSEARNAIDGRGYSIEAALDSLYDTNILRNSSVFNFGGRSRADFVFTPSATLRAGLPFGRQQLFGTFSVGRDYYARNTDYDRTRINVGGGANLHVGVHCEGSLYGQYAEQQGTQLDLIQSVPNKQQDTLYQANAGCGRERGFGFGGGYTRIETRNAAAIFSQFGSNTSVYSGNLRYNSGVRGTITLTGSYSNISYPNRIAGLVGVGNGLGNGDGVRVYSGQIAYRRNFGPRITTNVGVSYIKADPKLPTFDILGQRTNPGYSGPGFDVSVGYHPGTRLSGTLTASRNVTATANVGALYTGDSGYALDLSYALSPRISTGVGGSLSTRDYRGSFASPVNPVPLLNDTLHRVYAQVSYAPVKRYSISLTVAQQGRQSNPNIYNYDSTSGTVGLRLKF